MERLKILVVEDEVLVAEDLKDMLESLGFVNIELAHDKEGAITALKSFVPDIALLDIRMENELDGLEIGDYINANYKIPFIFITAHSDVAMIKEIVKTKPAAYITKPIKKFDLFANIKLATEKLNVDSIDKKRLILKDGYNTLLIDFDDIHYIESEGNYMNIICQSKKLVSRQTIDSIMKDLDERKFFRIQRSFIVNLTKVTKYSKKDLQIGNITLPISRNIYDEFENKIKSLAL